jgi:hypothetical protein
MQQHRETLAGFAAALRRAGVKRLQDGAVTTPEQQLVACCPHGNGSLLHARAARRQARENGLEMPAAKPATGSK